MKSNAGDDGVVAPSKDAPNQGDNANVDDLER